jgi:hypothetical protein
MCCLIYCSIQTIHYRRPNLGSGLLLLLLPAQQAGGLSAARAVGVSVVAGGSDFDTEDDVS